jgi:hypothetical protein
MLRTPSAHCRIPKHKKTFGSISVRLATYEHCCAHLAHTAEYRSINNPLAPFRSDSRHTENAAHTQRTLQTTEAQTTHWFHFGQTRDIQKMLRNAHCRIPKHKQPIGSLSVRLATYGKCCAHLAHTAQYRSTNNSFVPFRSDSRHTENAAHTQRTRART